MAGAEIAAQHCDHSVSQDLGVAPILFSWSASRRRPNTATARRRARPPARDSNASARPAVAHLVSERGAMNGSPRQEVNHGNCHPCGPRPACWTVWRGRSDDSASYPSEDLQMSVGIPAMVRLAGFVCSTTTGSWLGGGTFGVGSWRSVTGNGRLWRSGLLDDQFVGERLHAEAPAHVHITVSPGMLFHPTEQTVPATCPRQHGSIVLVRRLDDGRV